MNLKSRAAKRPIDAGPARSAPAVSLGRLGNFVGFRLRRVQNQLSRNFTAVTTELGLRQGLFSSLAIVAANFTPGAFDRSPLASSAVMAFSNST